MKQKVADLISSFEPLNNEIKSSLFGVISHIRQTPEVVKLTLLVRNSYSALDCVLDSFGKFLELPKSDEASECLQDTIIAILLIVLIDSGHTIANFASSNILLKGSNLWWASAIARSHLLDRKLKDPFYG